MPVKHPVEHYARCTVTSRSGLCVEPGIEVRDETLESLWLVLNSLALHAADMVERMGWKDALPLIRADFEHIWPGRAWFVEIHDKEGRGTQSYQPYGVPQRRRDAHHGLCLHGRTTCNEMTYSAGDETTEYPTREALDRVLVSRGIDPDSVKISSQKCGWVEAVRPEVTGDRSDKYIGAISDGVVTVARPIARRLEHSSVTIAERIKCERDGHQHRAAACFGCANGDRIPGTACDLCCSHTQDEDAWCIPIADLPGYASTLAINTDATADERDHLRAEVERLRAFVRRIPTNTKHGPRGMGGPGPCSADCVKCTAEELIEEMEP